MKDEYTDWIEKNVSEDCLNQCDVMTSLMQQTFPELKKVRGNVMLSSGYERPHWWLITDTGEIIDPTASQFSSEYYGVFTKIVEYSAINEETFVEPTGRCPNCGGLCYTGNTCCSDRCDRAYATYLGIGYSG